jgi:hypothetical protein
MAPTLRFPASTERQAPAAVGDGDVQYQRGNERNDKAGMHRRAAQARHRRRRRKLNTCRPAQAGGILPGAVDEIVHQQHGDVVQQQRRDGFVDVEARAQQPRKPAPEGAAASTGEQHDRQQQQHRSAGKIHHHGRSGERAEIGLALGADGNQAEPRRQDHGKRAKQDRRRLH